MSPSSIISTISSPLSSSEAAQRSWLPVWHEIARRCGTSSKAKACIMHISFSGGCIKGRQTYQIRLANTRNVSPMRRIGPRFTRSSRFRFPGRRASPLRCEMRRVHIPARPDVQDGDLEQGEMHREIVRADTVLRTSLLSRLPAVEAGDCGFDPATTTEWEARLPQLKWHLDVSSFGENNFRGVRYQSADNRLPQSLPAVHSAPASQPATLRMTRHLIASLALITALPRRPCDDDHRDRNGGQAEPPSFPSDTGNNGGDKKPGHHRAHHRHHRHGRAHHRGVRLHGGLHVAVQRHAHDRPGHRERAGRELRRVLGH